MNAHDTYVDEFVFQKFISTCCRPCPPPPSVCLLTASGGGDRPPPSGHPPLQRPTPKDIPSPQQAKEVDIAATAQYDWDIPGLLTLVAKSIVTSLNANAVDLAKLTPTLPRVAATSDGVAIPMGVLLENESTD